MPAERFSVSRDHVAGHRQAGSPSWFVPAVAVTGSDGNDGVPLSTGTDRSGVTVAGESAVAAANTARRGLSFQNTSDTAMRITESGTAATATTGYSVAPGGLFNANTNRAISVYCATAGKTFAATEW